MGPTNKAENTGNSFHGAKPTDERAGAKDFSAVLRDFSAEIQQPKRDEPIRALPSKRGAEEYEMLNGPITRFLASRTLEAFALKVYGSDELSALVFDSLPDVRPLSSENLAQYKKNALPGKLTDSGLARTAQVANGFSVTTEGKQAFLVEWTATKLPPTILGEEVGAMRHGEVLNSHGAKIGNYDEISSEGGKHRIIFYATDPLAHTKLTESDQKLVMLAATSVTASAWRENIWKKTDGNGPTGKLTTYTFDLYGEITVTKDVSLGSYGLTVTRSSGRTCTATPKFAEQVFSLIDTGFEHASKNDGKK